MQFMADIELLCESCKGKRFKEDVLEVKYKDKNIYNILESTVNQAIEFFSESESKVKFFLRNITCIVVEVVTLTAVCVPVIVGKAA